MNGAALPGKIAGSLAIGLTQLLAWVGVILAAVWIGISKLTRTWLCAPRW